MKQDISKKHQIEFITTKLCGGEVIYSRITALNLGVEHFLAELKRPFQMAKSELINAFCSVMIEQYLKCLLPFFVGSNKSECLQDREKIFSLSIQNRPIFIGVAAETSSPALRRANPLIRGENF